MTDSGQLRGEVIKRSALQDAIFNSAYFSSIATDEKGVIQIFNVGAERMLGFEASDVVDRITPADISDPGELIARAAELSRELDTKITPGFEALVFKASRGIEDIYELTYVRKDGSRFPAIVSVTALRDADESIIGYLLIGTDNTARMEVEAVQAQLDQALRDQQFYTRSLIESNIDALMTTDPCGIISDVNQQMVTLTGRTRDELIGAPCKNFFTDPLRADAAIEQVLAEDKVTDFELTVRHIDGTETLVSYNAATFHDRDRHLRGVFAAARDVTDRKRWEQTLQEKNTELEHASRMKSEFLATMSHELRTPLNAIIGFSEALGDGLMGPMAANQLEYIGDIFTSGQHLLSLINDILDLSKVEAGMMELELEPADLETLLANSLSIVRDAATSEHIRVEFTTEEPFGPLDLDTRKTKQIVYNLLSNAVKFSSPGGLVTLTARRVARGEVGLLSADWATHGFPLPASEHEQFLELRVDDEGIGISRPDMAKLFQSFSQIDSSLARKFEGTGLGLAMVKQLAGLHGGTVAVASLFGEGTRFAVWLPLRLSAATPPAVMRPRHVDSAPPGHDAGAARVALVVEDDVRSADLVRLLLEADGFTVLRASSAEEALELVPLHDLSVITLDVQLPGMNGWEFLAALRRTKASADIPVVIIAGLIDPHLALAGGASAVLQKPVSRAQLGASLIGLGLDPDRSVTRTVLVVDDDPKAAAVIRGFLPAPEYHVVCAYGGEQAISEAQRLLPDLILLDLMMPDVSGFDVVLALQKRTDTAAIPILVVTARNLSSDERAALTDGAGAPISVIEKAGFDRAEFMSQVRLALA